MVSSFDCRLLRPGLALIGLSALQVGCTQHDEITSYRVRKPELVDPTLVSAAASSTAPATEQQTIGLIIPIGDMAWFFKLTGDAKAVAPQHEAFLDFVQSIKFSPAPDSKPSWTLPAGWKDLPGREMRFATIQVAAEGKPLELSVIPLPNSTKDTQKLVLDNVNRWRQQLKLSAIAASDLATTTKSLQVDGNEATLVSLVGMGSGQMGGAPFAPFAGGAGPQLPPDHPPLAPEKSATSSKATANVDVRYDAPSEWSPGKSNAFSLAAFHVANGDKHADITVSTAGGDWLANVNRWRGQLGLPPTDAAELAKSTRPIETLGTTGDYVVIEGDEKGGQRESILGVQAQAAGRTWFVKLKGDAQLAQREKSRFEPFVKSLKTP